MTKKATPKPIRFSVPIAPDVLQVFHGLAAATGTSTGKAIGEWLMDTQDAVKELTKLLASVRRDPQKAAQRLNQVAVSLAEMTEGMLDEFKQPPEPGKAAGSPRRAAAADPRFSEFVAQVCNKPPHGVIRGGTTTKSSNKDNKKTRGGSL